MFNLSAKRVLVLVIAVFCGSCIGNNSKSIGQLFKSAKSKASAPQQVFPSLLNVSPLLANPGLSSGLSKSPEPMASLLVSLKDLNPRFENYGLAASTVFIRHGLTLPNAAGEKVFYGVISGVGANQSKFFAFNLDKKTTEFQQNFSAQGSWKLLHFQNDIYFGTFYPASLYRYSLESKNLELLGTLPVESQNEYIWDLSADSQFLYLGTYPGNPFRYEFSTKKFSSLGHLSNARYSRCILTVNNKVYIGFGGARSDGLSDAVELVEWDPATGVSKNVLDKIISWPGMPNHLAKVSNKIILATSQFDILQFDPSTQQTRVIHTGNDFTGAPRFAQGGAIFEGYGGALYEYVSGPLSVTRITPFVHGPALIDTTKFRFVTDDGGVGEQDFNWSNLGDPYLMTDFGLLPIAVRPFSIAANEGIVAVSDQKLNLFDIKNRSKSSRSILPEAKVIGFSSGSLFSAQYPSGTLWGYDKTSLFDLTSNLTTTQKYKILDFENQQMRPKSMALNGSKVLVGTEPGYGLRGGALTYYDQKDPSSKYTLRNIVSDHTITPVTFDPNDDQIAYLGSSAEGGTGTLPLDQNAHLIKWDLLVKRVIYDIVPEIPQEGFNIAIKKIIPVNDRVYVLSSLGSLIVLNANTGVKNAVFYNTEINDMVVGKDSKIFVSGAFGFGILDTLLNVPIVIKNDIMPQFGLMTVDQMTGQIFFVDGKLELWGYRP